MMRIVSQGVRLNVAEVGDLQAAFDQLPDQGGVLHLPAGIYEIDRTVHFDLREGKHLQLCGDGRGTVLRYTATDGSPMIDLCGVVGSWWPNLKITIRDLAFEGNYDCGDALLLRYPNDALIDACSFHHFGDTAIRITPQATNVTVRDCWMRDCQRALHADNLHHLTLHGMQTRSQNGGQIQREHVYIGRHCREVRIVNNHFAYGHAEGIILDGTAQHVVANNTIEGFPIGIRAVDCRDIAITSNYLHCDTGILMQEHNSGFAIANNICTDNDQGALVFRDAGGAGGHTITGNIIRQSVYETGQQGIDLGDAGPCVVSGNVFEDLTVQPPIAGSYAADHALADNLDLDLRELATQAMPAGDLPPPPPSDTPWFPLYEHLQSIPADTNRCIIALGQINRLLGDAAEAASTQPGWWRNEPAQPQAAAWLAAGWLVTLAYRIEGRAVLARI
ncbi:MAG: right-handed parallel beta-helix repeat-containing protein [Victivallales bacterium]|nr:right-handed parallel beta-helix repeat-containing protein [Victivallales bacterium]MBT7300680.1 right-handed parallel beta-helix repeat-containing protein [Victivallales bacterium]